jgi:APA family basic amino acid/polyamine antiporter
MANTLFTTKPLRLLLQEMEGEERLKRALGPVALTAVGVGAIIGTGIFVLTGVAAHDKAGPALTLSFVVAAIACIASAFCYSEFASMVPIAGSAYTYAYATLGELFAWIIGWDLVLEYAVGSASVAHGWSHYLQSFLKLFHVNLPVIISAAPIDYNPDIGKLVSVHSLLDLPAILITAVLTIILVRGIRQSSTLNSIIVIIKIAIIIFVIALGALYVNPKNWIPFAPYGYTGVGFLGKTLLGQTGKGGEPLGMLAGAAMVFFAYIGFDCVSTHAEEAKNPKKDIPIGIIASLLICTVLYIAVSAVLTGMVPYNKLSLDAPVTDAFRQVGLPWAQFLIGLGAITGMTSVLLVLMQGQARILLAMGRDGLLPHKFFGAVHPIFRTPWKSTILVGSFVMLLSGFLPLTILADLVSIGTLLAFIIVCSAVLIMRKTHPHVVRPFRVPFVPLIPLIGIGVCLLLMLSLPPESWYRLIGWLIVGLFIYGFYGRKNSVMAKELETEAGRHIQEEWKQDSETENADSE